MPVEDITPPGRDQVYTFAETLFTALAADKTVVTHCLAGIGRTTTMLIAAYLVHGYSLQELTAWISVRNPHFAFRGSQMAFSAGTGRGHPLWSCACSGLREEPAAMPVTLTVHDSQYPDRVAEQLRRGLRTRKLPGKFLYDSPAQAQRWLAYHQAYSPSRTEPALLTLYQQAFQAALQALSPSALHYVSLGCGGGNKDALFLPACDVTLSSSPLHADGYERGPGGGNDAAHPEHPAGADDRTSGG